MKKQTHLHLEASQVSGVNYSFKSTSCIKHTELSISCRSCRAFHFIYEVVSVKMAAAEQHTCSAIFFVTVLCTG